MRRPEPQDTMWIKAIRAGLCARYATRRMPLTLGYLEDRVCEHAVCDALLDVLDRVYVKDGETEDWAEQWTDGTNVRHVNWDGRKDGDICPCGKGCEKR